MSEELKVLAARMPLEVFNQGRVEVIDEVVHPEFVDHGTPLCSARWPACHRVGSRRPGTRFILSASGTASSLSTGLQWTSWECSSSSGSCRSLGSRSQRRFTGGRRCGGQRERAPEAQLRRALVPATGIGSLRGFATCGASSALAYRFAHGRLRSSLTPAPVFQGDAGSANDLSSRYDVPSASRSPASNPATASSSMASPHSAIITASAGSHGD
jgi:hypothetical protein